MMFRSVLFALAVAVLAVTPTKYGFAANPAFQSFFFDVCVNPTGALATRCSQTTGSSGDLSGDSESSLNPSQSLSSNDIPLNSARIRSKQAREREDRLREQSDEEEGGLTSQRFSLLVHTRNSNYETSRLVDIDSERTVDGDSWANEIGFDYRIGNNAFIGAIVGLENSDLDFAAENPGTNFTPAANAGDLSDDGTSVTIFGSVNLTDSFYFEGSAGVVNSDFEFHRNSVFQESGRIIPQTNVRTFGKTNGDVTWYSVGFGLDRQHNAMSFGPYFGAMYAKSTVDGYSEQDLNNSGLAMTYGDIERESMIAHAGFRISIAKSTDNGVILPQFRFEYQHDSDFDPSQLSATFLLDANANQYSLTGDQADKDYFETGLGVAWVLQKGWQPFVDLAVISANANRDQYRIAAGFRHEF